MRLIDADTVDNYIVGHVNLKDVPTINAIPVSENATNGDMIKATFNIKEIHAMVRTIFVVLYDGTEIEFKRDWWNAPYKRSNEE